MSTLLVEQYMIAAEDLADGADLDALLPCDPPDPADVGCVGAFIDSFGRRAYRKPLSDDLRQRLVTVHETGAEESAELGVRMAIQAVLQSPHFLYRFELGREGESGAVVPLTPYEIASQLSYLLWNTMPDADLLDAAEQGDLDSRSPVIDKAETMLADPRSRHVLWSFVQQLFELNLIPSATKGDDYAEFTPELAYALVEEAEAFVNYVVEDGAARRPSC